MFAAVLAPEPSATLEDVARDFSPRIERCGDREVVLDVHGLDRLIGDPPTIAAELHRTAAVRGLDVRVAIAGTRTAARLLVHAHPGVTVIEAGDERSDERSDERCALAPLPIHLLAVIVEEPDLLTPDLLTLRRWGLRTLGDLAALPDDAVAARLGQAGVAWQRLARGDDPGPLVPAVPEERFEQALDLEWPIDELEPLSFVLGRLMEPLSTHLERRDRGAAVLHVRLHLITREVHERSLQLPAPIRDARTLRTLALLDLESNPPPAAVDRVVVAVDPTPGRVVQFSLLTRPLPSPEQLSTLMARLTALMGEGRCGAPADVDAWKPGAFDMKIFAPRELGQLPTSNSQLPKRLHLPQLPTPNSQLPKRFHLSAALADSSGGGTSTSETARERTSGVALGVGNWALGVECPPIAFRRFRPPVPIRVRLQEGKPIRVTTDRRGLAGGRVVTSAGPWRTSGAWWDSHVWNRDEWDVTLQAGETYRLFHDRESGHWFLEGIVD